MKGASADPSVKTINNPNNSKKMMIGPSHHFLRTLRNCHNSDKIDNFPKFSS